MKIQFNLTSTQPDYFLTHPDTSAQAEANRPPNLSLQKDQIPKTRVPEGSHKTDPTMTTQSMLENLETPGTHPPNVLSHPDTDPLKKQDLTPVISRAVQETPVQTQFTQGRARSLLTVSNLK